MKKIWYLTKSELKRLKKSFIIIAVILTIFLAALLGIVSVETDMMRNLCNHLDTLSDDFYVSVENATFADFAIARDLPLTAVDPYVDIVGADGTEFKYDQTFVDDEGLEHHYYSSGQFFYVNEAMKNSLSAYDERLTGRWMENDYEICLSRYVYDKLNARLGDAVTIDGRSFTVVGVFNWEDNDDLINVFGNTYFATVGDDVVHERVTVEVENSTHMFELVRHFKKRGFEIFDFRFQWMYVNIMEVQAALTAVVVMLGIVIIVTLYSLISMLFRQRKTHVCRLKILGATNGDVAAVYCGIIIALLLCVVLVATALGIAFNYYFMDLCEQLLEFTFTVQFNVYAPFVAFGALCGVTYLLWLLVNRKTKASLAEEIRYE